MSTTIRLIQKGASFGKLIMDLAYEFIEKPNPSYYEKELRKATRNLRRLKRMTVEEAFETTEALAKTNFRRDRRKFDKRIKEIKELKKRCLAMLVKLKAWKPPKRLNYLKRDAISDVKYAIETECDISDIEPPEMESPPERIIASNLEQFSEDVERCSRRFRKELTQLRNFNNLIHALLKSLSALKKKKLSPPKKKAVKKPSKKTKSRKRGRPKISR